jgi:phenylpropionate dioxygenase-like ring-hydroxylating dioxygenase large terminal subunit
VSATAGIHWLKDTWQVAAISHELGHTPLARTIMEEPLVLFRDADGRAGCLEDRCPHRLVPLSRGRYHEGTLECGYHGLQFDTDGVCVAIPGQTSIPAGARARSYPVIERFGWVWVWMGRAADANPELLPAGHYHWGAEPGWRTVYGHTHFAANYQLLVDNLLDLSHESFLHQETIGNRAIADSPVTAQIVDDRMVRAERSMPDCDPPPMFKAVNGFASRIDRWHATVYLPPAYILVESGAAPAGDPDRRNATERRNMFPLTPETRTSTHMFWAIARNNELDNPEVDAYLLEKGALTQEQDRAMIEAQQRTIGDTLDISFPVAIRVDIGPTLGRRVHDRAIEASKRIPEEALP